MFLFYFYSAEKIYNKLYVISVIICEMTEVPVPYVAVSIHLIFLNLKYMCMTFYVQNLVGVAHNSVRFRSGMPFNTIILFVPQQEAWVIERFGKFHRVLEPVSNSSVSLLDCAVGKVVLC